MKWKIAGAVAALCSAAAVAASPSSATIHNSQGCPISFTIPAAVGLSVENFGDSGIPYFYPVGTELTFTIHVCSNTKLQDVIVSASAFPDQGGGGTLLDKTIKNLSPNGNGKQFKVTWTVVPGVTQLDFDAFAPTIPEDPGFPPFMQLRNTLTLFSIEGV